MAIKILKLNSSKEGMDYNLQTLTFNFLRSNVSRLKTTWLIKEKDGITLIKAACLNYYYC